MQGERGGGGAAADWIISKMFTEALTTGAQRTNIREHITEE